MRRRALVAGLAVPLLASCRSAPSPASPTAAPAATTTPRRPTSAVPVATVAPTAAVKSSTDVLFIRGVSGGKERLSLVAAATGKLLRELPLGVPGPAWSTMYVAETVGGKTTVQAIDVASGQVLRETTLDGTFTLPAGGLASSAGLSPDGRWLVLNRAPSQDELKAYQQSDHWKSDLVVLDTDFKLAPRIVKLDGSFWFDAIDDEGKSLYLIENLSQVDGNLPGTRYHVREYDLAQDRLQPGVVADKTASTDVMSGFRHSALASPDGQWVYSLYLNQTKGPFIHALNLPGHYAVCIFLPTAGKDDFEKGLLWTLAMPADGSKLFAANAALGLISQVTTSSLSLRNADLAVDDPRARIAANLFGAVAASAEAKRVLMGGSALTPDGRTLFVLGDHGFLSIDAVSLTLRGSHLTDWVLDSVAISPDGARLYVLSAERRKVLQIDPSTVAIVGEIGLDRQPIGLLKVGG